ncbi:septum site-determining protein MinC [Paenibacillus nasutitermitis]|uniref:Probable septum site-determining protein MinC n=1 Tax=Paenibacillus nasutitermitis TaxID=1652958 RepID=A0A916YP39_9BACL|nr:septum site-determining protein MinC [Paenibacillus nasutitermitis]GGD54613.1 putative septum site-determining protein MinC [Paenibacillus nasutitermitis]
MTEKQHITIKGVKEGLVFLLDDQCEFSLLLQELQYKLEKSHQQLLTGPIVHVHVKLGTRLANEEEKDQIKSVIRKQGNLIVQSVESDAQEKPEIDEGNNLRVLTGIIRSGQTVEHHGNLLLMGDLNPGGSLLCTGDIYVLGSLRGLAHAGTAGKTEAIIAASLLRPTQLRISEVISRPPDEWMTGDAAMEFAYLNDGMMKIDKMTQLYRIRNQSFIFKA